MRILILTSDPTGLACSCVPALANQPGIDLAGIILAQKPTPKNKHFFQRKFKKILTIGILGTLNGIRLRKWYQWHSPAPITSIAEALHIKLFKTSVINSDQTQKIFRDLNVDLGLSIGNGYIAEKVFSIPKYGMINIHMEILPDVQGGRSIIWPIYHGHDLTGFTIHQIDRNIDTGDILYQEKYPIQFSRSLRQTVENNLLAARDRIPQAFCHTCQNYLNIKQNATPQGPGKTYTTPTFGEYLRIVSNHRKLKKRDLPSHRV